MTTADGAAPSWRAAVHARGPLLAVIAVGLLARLAGMAVFGPDDVELYEFGVIGENLVDGRGYTFYAEEGDGVAVDDDQTGRPLPSAFMPPGYTVTVAGALAVTSSHDATARLLQVLNLAAAAAGIALMYVLGTRLFGPLAGLLAALAYALYPALVYQATQASSSNLYLPLELAGAALLIRAADTGSTRWAAAAGACLGVTCLFRSEVVVIIALALVWLWRRLRVAAPGVAPRVLAAFLVPALAFPAAWMVRNAVVLGEPVATITTSGGFNLWIGNHEGASGSQKEFAPEDDELRARLDDVPADDGYEVGRDEVYLDEALDFMTDDIVATVGRGLEKLALTLTIDWYDDRSTNPVYIASWVVLAALGVLGALRRRLPPGIGSLLWGYVAFSLVVPMVFFSLARYKLAVEIPLMLLAAGLVAAWSARRHPRLRSWDGTGAPAAPVPSTAGATAGHT